MRFTKKERDLDTLSLEGFGLLPEEIEGYFDFYDEMWVANQPKKRRTMIINSRKKSE